MKYFIAENGQQAGPFEPSELLLHGLTVNSLVWCEGMPNWTSASQVPELMALLSGQTFNPSNVDIPVPPMPQMPQMPPVGTPMPQQVPPFGGQGQPTNYGPQPNTDQPYAQPQYGPSNQQQSRQVMPKTWLTESIIATVACSMCCGVPLIGLIPGVIAIFMALKVKSKFNSGDFDGANKNSASARMWMIITIGVGIASAIYGAYTIISNPELLQQIQNGSIGSLYGL